MDMKPSKLYYFRHVVASCRCFYFYFLFKLWLDGCPSINKLFNEAVMIKVKSRSITFSQGMFSPNLFRIVFIFVNERFEFLTKFQKEKKKFLKITFFSF